MTDSTFYNHHHAIVIGGSMAGLITSRILLNHFDQVTLVERDRFPYKPQQRHGVPQASHVHVLLTQGQRIFEQLFPGFIAELVAAGCPTVNWTQHFPWYSMEGWQPRFSSDLITYTCSRNFLEWVVRRRVASSEPLNIVDNCRALELLTNSDQSRITGVKLHDQDSSHPQELSPDLVVDASGRNSLTPKWLTQLGYQSPQETVVNSFLGYGSRWYEIPPEFEADWKGLLIDGKPPKMTRSGVLYPVEGNRWVVTLVGVGRDYPPTDEAEFIEFARSLRHPILYETLKQAKPLSPIYSYRRTENRLRHYEKLSKLPEGLVAVGDAVCAFNPVYGQGMTTATLGALTLDNCLQRQPNLKGLPRRFYKQLSQMIQNPWLMATGEDFRWETTEGGKPDLKTQLTKSQQLLELASRRTVTHKYMDKILQLTVKHPDLYQTFVESVHMVKPPSALFHPKYILRVLGQMMNKPANSDELTPTPTIPTPLF